jgi:hypothetical protein
MIKVWLRWPIYPDFLINCGDMGCSAAGPMPSMTSSPRWVEGLYTVSTPHTPWPMQLTMMGPRHVTLGLFVLSTTCSKSVLMEDTYCIHFLSHRTCCIHTLCAFVCVLSVYVCDGNELRASLMQGKQCTLSHIQDLYYNHYGEKRCQYSFPPIWVEHAG